MQKTHAGNDSFFFLKKKTSTKSKTSHTTILTTPTQHKTQHPTTEPLVFSWKFLVSVCAKQKMLSGSLKTLFLKVLTLFEIFFNIWNHFKSFKKIQKVFKVGFSDFRSAFLVF